VDGRGYKARRWKALRNLFLDQLNDDPDEMPQSRRHLLHALTDVALQLEVVRCEMVDGDPVDPNTLNKLARTFARLSAQIGLER
jgi:hypothetical protein